MLFARGETCVAPIQEQLPASILHLSIEYGFEEPVCHARDSLAKNPIRKRSPYPKEMQIHIAHYPRVVQIANYMKRFAAMKFMCGIQHPFSLVRLHLSPKSHKTGQQLI